MLAQAMFCLSRITISKCSTPTTVVDVDLIQALGGGYLAGPEAFVPRPEPETDQLTPLVDAIEVLGGG